MEKVKKPCCAAHCMHLAHGKTVGERAAASAFWAEERKESKTLRDKPTEMLYHTGTVMGLCLKTEIGKGRN